MWFEPREVWEIRGADITLSPVYNCAKGLISPARGLSLRDSLVEAGAVRLRPIVMTTLAMIFGMAPLALGLGEGGEQRAPMAHAVIGGLLSSTVLTLIFVPVVITYLEGFARRVRPFLPRSADDVPHEAAAE